MADLSYDDVLARNIRAARARLGITQQRFAKRMRALGYTAWMHQTVGNVEKGRRRLLAGEILGAALALETTIPALMAASPDDKEVLLPSGDRIEASSARAQAGGFRDGAVVWKGDEPVFTGGRRAWWGALEDNPNLPERAVAEEPKPVCAAVVTAPELGVLVGRRNDGAPLWTLIAGEQEDGERPGDTVIREVKEEAMLRVQAGDVIGERMHPKSGRLMVYVAAYPTHGTDVGLGDEDELAEVKWIGLEEADELLPGLFGPVRDFLGRVLGETGRV
jgi:8-oxo-dGTP diphosphatase